MEIIQELFKNYHNFRLISVHPKSNSPHTIPVLPFQNPLRTFQIYMNPEDPKRTTFSFTTCIESIGGSLMLFLHESLSQIYSKARAYDKSACHNRGTRVVKRHAKSRLLKVWVTQSGAYYYHIIYNILLSYHISYIIIVSSY